MVRGRIPKGFFGFKTVFGGRKFPRLTRLPSSFRNAGRQPRGGQRSFAARTAGIYIKRTWKDYTRGLRETKGWKQKIWYRPYTEYYRTTPNLPLGLYDLPISLYQAFKLRKGPYVPKMLYILGIPLRARPAYPFHRSRDSLRRVPRILPFRYEAYFIAKRAGMDVLVRRIVNELQEGMMHNDEAIRDAEYLSRYCKRIQGLIYKTYRINIPYCYIFNNAISNAKRKKRTWR